MYGGVDADTMRYLSMGQRIYLEEGTPLDTWYADDFRDLYEHDNSGRHCVDVYAKISDDV